jgi:hypothetical protein
MKTESCRPLGVTAIGVFLLGAAVFASITGMSLLLPNSFIALVWRLNESSLRQFESMGIYSSAALLLSVAAVAIIAGVALLQGRKVGWWIALILFLIQGVGIKIQLQFLNGSMIGDWIGLSVVFLVVAYLSSHKIRKYFHEPIRNRFLLKILQY